MIGRLVVGPSATTEKATLSPWFFCVDASTVMAAEAKNETLLRSMINAAGVVEIWASIALDNAGAVVTSSSPATAMTAARPSLLD